ncbi:hypothetical protein F5148DRAFT_1197142 [Russula earlei]|uniref:Uncharacterized protein n=1 Tax=Russula earlei TaxID=71964 RepID=A0ACC0U9H0_9AGAM|nr:hypothetical protein F5148DRAFT_1197142 [Russula earlei]
MRRAPPEITEKPQRRISLVPPRTPHPPIRAHKTEPVPEQRPEPVRDVSFEQHVSIVPDPTPASSAPSSPQRRSIPLPRCKGRTSDTGAVSPPPPPASIAADNSPLSSAETLTEAPAEVKRALSARLTRVLLFPRGRRVLRSSTPLSPTTSSSSATVVSEFGDHVGVSRKGESLPKSDGRRPNVSERGRFGFLKKSKTIDEQTRGSATSCGRPSPMSMHSLASVHSPSANSSADSIPSARLTNSPLSLSFALPDSSEQIQHRRVMSTPSASSKLRRADKICPRKEKAKGVEPRPKPARTQPYGPPYNWVPPTPGAWAVVEETDDERVRAERRRKRVSAPTVVSSSQDVRRFVSGSATIPRPTV